MNPIDILLTASTLIRLVGSLFKKKGLAKLSAELEASANRLREVAGTEVTKEQWESLAVSPEWRHRN